MSDRLQDVPHDLASLVALLRWRSQHEPERTAYTFLVDGETAEAALTYRDIDGKARALGAYLQTLVAPGARVLLMLPPGPDYIAAFFGCLYAGVIAVPTYLPNVTRPNQTFARLQAIVRDAQPSVAIIPATLRPSIERLSAQEPAFHALRWIEMDMIPDTAADTWQDLGIDSTTLAFLQYTSGSTATPKGVMLTHAHLLHNLGLIHDAFAHTPSSRGVIWLPPYHDMGLIGGLLQPVYGGFPVTLMSPVHFLQRPIRWLQAITRTQATTSGGPNFAYDLCVRNITPEQRATLDLSSWTVAFTGAEPIRADTLERFAATFAPCGFRREAWYPCYGLAEATLIVAGGTTTAPPIIRTYDSDALEQNHMVEVPEDDERGRVLVGCGQTLGEQQVVIVDPVDRTQRGVGQVGEVWVAGSSVAQGYWNRPEETRHTFHASLADSNAGPFLRTGDLGVIHERELFITGRLKDLIIIRGRNHYPQDIELTVEQSHAALRPGSGAAFSIEVTGEERLVVVQEIERHARRTDVAAIAGAIRQAVMQQHELQVYGVVLLKPGRIPKTSSGKIQRQQCRQAFLAGTLDVVASSILDETSVVDDDRSLTRAALLAIEPEARPDILAAYLQRAIATVLRVAPAQVEHMRSIRGLGLDSVMAIELRYRLERDLEVEIPLTAFLKDWSLADLATYVGDQVATARNPLALPGPAERQAADRYPLSSAQTQFWFLEQMAPGNPAHIIAATAQLTGHVNDMALEQSLNEIIRRHEALRTTFTVIDGQPVQQIAPALHIPLVRAGLQTASAAERRQEIDRWLQNDLRHAFDLARGPLIRTTLLHLGADEYVLLLVVHHSVADGWSMGVIFREVAALYTAFSQQRSSPLAELPLQYIEFAVWQQQWLQSEAARAELAYWQEQLRQLPVLSLPTDRLRPIVQTFHGARHTFTIPNTLRQALEALSRHEGVTLFTTLLAAFQVLLARYTGQTDIVVGSPIAQRNQAVWEGLVGSFANVLVLRGDLSGNPSVRTLLRRLWNVVLGAYEHQTLPFEQLVGTLQPHRDPSRHPLFQVAFVLQNMPLPEIQLPDVSLQVLDTDPATARFDLKLELIPRQDVLVGWLEYNIDLFEPATIRQLQEHLCSLLEGFVVEPERPIAHLPLLSRDEQQRILYEWNRTVVEYPEDACIHQLFEAHVAHTPAATALVFDQQELTYAELNWRANQVAHTLQAQGIGPEACVGVLLERSPEMIIAILGILKAGGAYLPLDPAYPTERLQFMLADSGTRVLVTQQRFSGIIADQLARVIYLDAEWSSIAEQPVDNLPARIMPNNPAYLIYTSGSTGQPKGVLSEHQGVVSLAQSQKALFGVGPGDRILQCASLSFDISVFEIVMALASGATLCLARAADLLPGLPLKQLLSTHAITTVTLTPSVLAVLPPPEAADDLPALRTIIAGGEECSSELVARWAPGRAFFNGYGPTEASVCATATQCRPDGTKPPIGRPLGNTRVYVLDAHQQPVPVGVPGELYIAGVGLARGYINRPDVTAERFLPDPFSRGAPAGTDACGARMYRTGDLVRYRGDGQIEFLGRIDQQVKIRGYRIELGEIEAVLAGHPSIHEAAVVAREDTPGARRLVAYVVEEHSHGSTLDTVTWNPEQANIAPETHNRDLRTWTSELKAYVKERLPEYMIPAVFVALPALPKMPSGKLDRRALPTPDKERPTLETTYVAPHTEIEATIAGIWRELLDIEQVGIHDNFFELGGHSLLIVQLQTRLRETFATEIAIVDLFQYPTIRLLAERLRQPTVEQPTFQQHREQGQNRKAAMQQQAQRRRARPNHEQ